MGLKSFKAMNSAPGKVARDILEEYPLSPEEVMQNSGYCVSPGDLREIDLGGHLNCKTGGVRKKYNSGETSSVRRPSIHQEKNAFEICLPLSNWIKGKPCLSNGGFGID